MPQSKRDWRVLAEGSWGADPEEDIELYGSPFGSFCSLKESGRRDWRFERLKSHEIFQSRK